MARRRDDEVGSNEVEGGAGGSAGSAPPRLPLRRPSRRHDSARLRSMSARSAVARGAAPRTSLGAGTARSGRATGRRWSWVGAPGALVRRLPLDAAHAATTLPVDGACRRARPWLGEQRRAPRSAPGRQGRVERRGSEVKWERRRASGDSRSTPLTPRRITFVFEASLVLLPVYLYYRHEVIVFIIIKYISSNKPILLLFDTALIAIRLGLYLIIFNSPLFNIWCTRHHELLYSIIYR